MVNSYDNMMGDESDPMDHPAYGGHNDGFNKPRAGGTQMAGDVIPLPAPTGPGAGIAIDAPAYALGQKSDPKVISIGRPTINRWIDNRKK